MGASASKLLEEAERRGVVEIDLSKFNLKSLLPEIEQLKNTLARMILSSNQLSSLPFEVSQLYCLRHIDLSRNRFKVFPAALNLLPALESIDISHNKLKKFPLALGASLQSLDISYNRIREVGASIVDSRLKHLDLSGNPLVYPPKHILARQKNDTEADWLAQLKEYILLNATLRDDGGGFDSDYQWSDEDEPTAGGRRNSAGGRRRSMDDLRSGIFSMQSSPTQGRSPIVSARNDISMPTSPIIKDSHDGPTLGLSPTELSQSLVFPPSAPKTPMSPLDDVAECERHFKRYFRQPQTPSSADNSFVQASRGILVAALQLWRATVHVLEPSTNTNTARLLWRMLGEHSARMTELVGALERVNGEAAASGAAQAEALVALKVALSLVTSSCHRLVKSFLPLVPLLLNTTDTGIMRSMVAQWQACLVEFADALALLNQSPALSVQTASPQHRRGSNAGHLFFAKARVTARLASTFSTRLQSAVTDARSAAASRPAGADLLAGLARVSGAARRAHEHAAAISAVDKPDDCDMDGLARLAAALLREIDDLKVSRVVAEQNGFSADTVQMLGDLVKTADDLALYAPPVVAEEAARRGSEGRSVNVQMFHMRSFSGMPTAAAVALPNELRERRPST